MTNKLEALEALKGKVEGGEALFSDFCEVFGIGTLSQVEASMAFDEMSFDAAVNVVEEELPDFDWSIHSGGEAFLKWGDNVAIKAWHAEPAVSLLLAAISALISQEKDKTDE